MILKLDAGGWIGRTPGQARSIGLRVVRDRLRTWNGNARKRRGWN
ncbi:MAG TPA: hypothetical protein VEX86_07930 [Longimicrobium sp.]|nr:hypothetical protein [Longimicrobium sp.]